MKKIFFAAALTVYGQFGFAQSAPGQPATVEPPAAITGADTGLTFAAIDHVPEFPGGKNGLQQFLANNIHYPKKARNRDIEGKVIVKFIVCQDGTLCNEQIVQSVGGGCDEEVLRVVKAMPNWTPGMHDGKAVKVYYTLPVNFKLDYPKRKNKN